MHTIISCKVSYYPVSNFNHNSMYVCMYLYLCLPACLSICIMHVCLALGLYGWMDGCMYVLCMSICVDTGISLHI